MRDFWRKKRIFVTGACGTVGKELVRQLLEDYEVSELIGIDNNESELFFVEQRFSRFQQASFYLADVRDRENLCSTKKSSLSLLSIPMSSLTS